MNSPPDPDKSARQEGALQFPYDFGEWFDRGQLLAWIEEDVATLNWSHPELVEFLRRNPQARPRLLLVVLTLAYATGTFESGMIANQCGQDGPLNAICGDWVPSEGVIARFRRENRGLLKWSLFQLFKRALRTRYRLSDSLLPPGLKGYLVDLAVNRLDTARQFDRASTGF